MNSQDYWQLFMDTGSPEIYLLYNEAKKVESTHVYNNSRPRVEGHTIQ